jgi:hypothetical protein
LTILFVGGLEYALGTTVAAVAYFIPMIATNPITGFILVGELHPLLKSMDPSEIDIGMSLGVMGCAGALFRLLKHRYILVFSILIGSILDIWLIHGFMPLNHYVSVFLGILLGKGLNYEQSRNYKEIFRCYPQKVL